MRGFFIFTQKNMDLTKYNNLIDRIAKGLTNGTIKQEDIKTIVESELGPVSSDTKRLTDEEREAWKKEREIKRQTQPLYKAFIDYWLCISAIKKHPDPFTIKHNASKLMEHLQIIKSFKEDPYYIKVLLDAASWADKGMGDIEFTAEHIKSLNPKYL